MIDPIFQASTYLLYKAQKLEELDHAAPKKPFLDWWTSIQTERHSLIDTDHIFTWYIPSLVINAFTDINPTNILVPYVLIRFPECSPFTHSYAVMYFTTNVLNNGF
jgi:hypothetical protein